MNTHVGLQIAFGGEGPGAYAALEGSFTRMGPVVHLESRFAGQDSVTNDAFIGVGQLVLDVVHQLLKFGCLTRLLNFNQRLP